MAATWIKPLHVSKGKTIAQTLNERTDYAENPDKTKGGQFVRGYMCDPHTADEEFLLSKREYDYITERKRGNRNILAYHIRQSFKPGEITPELANSIGHELALRFTKGKHQFIVATHIDKFHIHNHVVFNSTTIDCTKKFNNFFGSSFAVRRLSDIICAEHGLSVIENPKPSQGKNYADWLGEKEPSWQEKLCRKIDEVLPSCSAFEDFLAAMKATGYEVNDKRKHITFLAPGQKKPTRLDTLGGDYTEAAIRERLSGTRTVASASAGGLSAEQASGHTRVSLLIDIQAKIREGKGGGYEHWARIFNIKEAAKTLIFLKENGIDSYDDLVKRASSASSDFSALNNKIKDADKRMAEISELQKYIGQYGKTRDVYAQYRKSGWNEKFYEEHRADITLHRAAKKYFDDLGYGKDKKLPTIASLKQEYAALMAEKKKLYSGYHAAKKNMQDLLIAKSNADKTLGIKPETQNRDASRSKTQRGTDEIQ